MKSPCNDICTIDRPTGLCVGCGRSLSEIGEWASASEARRQAIFALLPARIAALGDKFRG
ncbi:DUF1289 domain-containing protein [Parasphingorhabdus sp.]|uniref:DUF1289 domain-containing protein n=1 Tax=Parasphingorhabdus sp. TaxID=2709688 RepID=UPI0030021953